jgi:hypothetical protein
VEVPQVWEDPGSLTFSATGEREDAMKKSKPKVIRKGNIVTVSYKGKGVTFWDGSWIFWRVV